MGILLRGWRVVGRGGGAHQILNVAWDVVVGGGGAGSVCLLLAILTILQVTVPRSQSQTIKSFKMHKN